MPKWLIFRPLFERTLNFKDSIGIMKFESVTIKDIAKVLHLSTSTVSRALRDSYEISEETKKLVVEYAKSVNYRPNPSALNLKKRRSRTLGITISEIANSFFSQIIAGVESVAQEKGYNVIISQSFENFEREQEAVRNLSQSVDGMLISLSSETKSLEHIEQLQDRGMPVVFFDRITKSLEGHKVRSNNFKGAFQATAHLIQNGYTRIAFVGNPDNLAIIKERKRGYDEALESHQIPPTEAYIKYCLHGGLSYDEVERVMEELLQLENPPQAILSCADKITTNCYRYLVKHDIRIPDQMALVGFSNLDLTEFLHPSLSIIQQKAVTMGVQAAELLIQQIESKRPVVDFSEIVLEPDFFARASSAPSDPGK